MKDIRNILTFIFLISIAFVSEAADSQKLRIHGSNTVGASLAPKLVNAWLHSKNYTVLSDVKTAAEERLLTALNPSGDEIVIEIHAHGSSTAFKDLADNRTDIGMASRPIKRKELEQLAFLGQLDLPTSEYVVALDGLSVIVHPNNPLTQIDKKLLRSIFSGETTNWSQLGLPPGKITVYARDNNSGTYDTFKALVLDKKTPLTSNARRYESNSKLSDAVAKDRNAIGFVGLAYVRKSKMLAVADEGAKAIKPLPFNVATEDYVLSRRLFLYVPYVSGKVLAHEFANFAVSQNTQAIVDKVGFVSQSIKSSKQGVKKNAPQEYQELTKNAERLSLNIRFRSSYVRLDNKAIRDIDRLVKFMSQPKNRQRKLMLFGFADEKEALPYISLSLSIDRADAVAEHLIKNGLSPERIRGFGQELPVASNMTNHGRHYNRRVEVWVQ